MAKAPAKNVQNAKNAPDIFARAAEPSDMPCFVVADGRASAITWREIFDPARFDTLRAATYVSGATFFAEAAAGFKRVVVLLGIDSSDLNRNFISKLTAMIELDGPKFFDELPDDAKRRLALGEIEVRCAKPEAVIHSKIFLLSNSETGARRLVVGSANLTLQAFSGDIKQYEDVMLFDFDGESELFSVYEDRFEKLRALTVDFVPEDRRKKFLDGELVKVADMSDDDRTDELIRSFRESNIIPLCSEAIMAYAEEAAAAHSAKAETVRVAVQTVSNVSSRTKSRSTGETIIRMKEPEKIKRETIKELVLHAPKQELDLNRFALAYNPGDGLLYDARTSEPFCREASADEIAASLANIEDFILAYKNFVFSPDATESNLTRIYEIILYAFTSTYLFKIRQEASEENLPEIHIMLVIGGRARSGKSTLLGYLDAVMSGRSVVFSRRFLQYRDIASSGGVENMFHSDNVYPIMVDEVPLNFFTSAAASANRGEEFIKYLSNTLNKVHPVMICTTNADNFSVPPQVERRVYFLKVDCTFDESKKASKAYLKDVMSSATTALFRDFCRRMAEQAAAGELMRPDSNDYLAVAREIFAEYYAEAGRARPEYFPVEPFRDYMSRGRDIWRRFYKQKQDDFKYSDDDEDSEPMFDVSLKEIMGGARDVGFYVRYLRPDLLKEATGHFVTIRARPFLEWIGAEDRRGVFGLWRRLFGRK